MSVTPDLSGNMIYHIRYAFHSYLCSTDQEVGPLLAHVWGCDCLHCPWDGLSSAQPELWHLALLHAMGYPILCHFQKWRVRLSAFGLPAPFSSYHHRDTIDPPDGASCYEWWHHHSAPPLIEGCGRHAIAPAEASSAGFHKNVGAGCNSKGMMVPTQTALFVNMRWLGFGPDTRLCVAQAASQASTPSRDFPFVSPGL